MLSSGLSQQLWNQFGAAIDMLSNCIRFVPEDYLKTNKRFYYLAYHTIVFLDYYSCIPPSEFAPLLPFTHQLPENCPPDSVGDMIPDAIFTKEELLNYIHTVRLKSHGLISSITEDSLNNRFKEGSEEGDMDYPLLEILFYNLRHTAHHVGQLNQLIRQDFNQHMEWSFREGDI